MRRNKFVDEQDSQKIAAKNPSPDHERDLAGVAVESVSGARQNSVESVADSDADIIAQLPSFQPQHRRLLRIGIVFMLTILALEWIYLATRRPDPLLLERGDTFREQFRVEINSATWVDWLQLDGIGPSLAHRIVAHQKLNGPFKSIDEVARVPGIGKTTLDRIRPWLTIRHDLIETKSADSSTTRPTDKQPAESEQQPSTL